MQKSLKKVNNMLELEKYLTISSLTLFLHFSSWREKQGFKNWSSIKIQLGISFQEIGSHFLVQC